jgi:hypothetical protein
MVFPAACRGFFLSAAAATPDKATVYKNAHHGKHNAKKTKTAAAASAASTMRQIFLDSEV